MSAVSNTSPKYKGAKLDTGEEVNGQVALFISKVWRIVGEPETNNLISWSESGKTFVVHKESSFAKEVLPRFFKHSNFTSFVRQLNLYGFRKVAKPDHGGLTSIREDSVEFWHTNFRKGHPELLPLVQRRPVSKSDDKPDVSQLMSDIHQMKEKQETIGTLIEDLKDENFFLKKEVQALKIKHDLQHKVLNKIIHFVIQMVYKGKMPMPILRNPLMLAGSDDTGGIGLPPPKRSKTSHFDSYNVAQNSPMLYDVSSPDIPSIRSVPSSPVAIYDESQSTGSGQSIQQTSVPAMAASYDDTITTQSFEYGDEFLANLLNSSTTSAVTTESLVQSQTTPILQAATPKITTPHSQIGSFPYPQAGTNLVTTSSAGLQPQVISPKKPHPAPLTTRIQCPVITQPSQIHLPQSSQNNQQQPTISGTPQLQNTDVVPYNNARMSSVASHIDSHQVELDSLPDVLHDQLEVDPEILISLLSGDYNQTIPEYDIVDTTRLLESFMDPDKDVCHESTVQIPSALSGLPTLALPAGDSSSAVSQPSEKTLQTLIDTPSSSSLYSLGK